MTQTSTLCSHRSISQSCGELNLVDAMYYFLGTCAAGGPPQHGLASLARRSPEPASRAHSTQDCSTRTTVVLWSQRCAPRLPHFCQHGPRCSSRRLSRRIFSTALDAHSPSLPSPLGSETRRASPLHGVRHEAPGSQLAHDARRRAPASLPSI